MPLPNMNRANEAFELTKEFVDESLRKLDNLADKLDFEQKARTFVDNIGTNLASAYRFLSGSSEELNEDARAVQTGFDSSQGPEKLEDVVDAVSKVDETIDKVVLAAERIAEGTDSLVDQGEDAKFRDQVQETVDATSIPSISEAVDPEGTGGLLSRIFAGSLAGNMLAGSSIGGLIAGVGTTIVRGMVAALPAAAIGALIAGGIAGAVSNANLGMELADEIGSYDVSGAVTAIMFGVDGDLMSHVASIGTWAAAGAAIGSVVPVVGTLLGAFVGAAIGGLANLFGEYIGFDAIARTFDDFIDWWNEGLDTIFGTDKDRLQSRIDDMVQASEAAQQEKQEIDREIAELQSQMIAAQNSGLTRDADILQSRIDALVAEQNRLDRVIEANDERQQNYEDQLANATDGLLAKASDAIDVASAWIGDRTVEITDSVTSFIDDAAYDVLGIDIDSRQMLLDAYASVSSMFTKLVDKTTEYLRTHSLSEIIVDLINLPVTLMEKLFGYVADIFTDVIDKIINFDVFKFMHDSLPANLQPTFRYITGYGATADVAVVDGQIVNAMTSEPIPPHELAHIQQYRLDNLSAEDRVVANAEIGRLQEILEENPFAFDIGPFEIQIDDVHLPMGPNFIEGGPSDELLDFLRQSNEDQQTVTTQQTQPAGDTNINAPVSTNVTNNTVINRRTDTSDRRSDALVNPW